MTDGGPNAREDEHQQQASHAGPKLRLASDCELFEGGHPRARHALPRTRRADRREREVDQALAKGKFVEFTTAQEAITYLHQKA